MLQQPIRIRLRHDILASVHAVQYDTHREFHFIFDDYEVPSDVEEIRVYLVKPSGYEIYNYATLINDEAVYQPTSQTLAEVGEVLGQIQIINKNEILTSFHFKVFVEKNLVNDSDIVSSDEFLILDELIKTAQADIAALEELHELVTQQEAARQQAEQLRQQAESQRETDEAQRKQSELERNQAEEARKSAETERVEEFNQIKSDAQDATQAANTAAGNSTSAADRANEAAQRAEDATQGIANSIQALINDDSSSATTTYSSDKILELFQTCFIASVDEPVDQVIGGIWLQDESTEETT